MLGAVGLWLHQWRAPTMRAWNQIAIGQTEVEVRRLIGAPIKEYVRDEAPDDYRIEGYGRPDRSITGKVLIYLATDLVLYVWLDANGRVEETFVASS